MNENLQRDNVKWNWKSSLEMHKYVGVDVTHAQLFRDENIADLKALYKHPETSWFLSEKARIQDKFNMTDWEFFIWLEKTLPLLEEANLWELSLEVNKVFTGMRFSLAVKKLVNEILENGTCQKNDIEIIANDIFPWKPKKVEAILKRNGITIIPEQKSIKEKIPETPKQEETQDAQWFLSTKETIPNITLWEKTEVSPAPVINQPKPKKSITQENIEKWEKTYLESIAEFFPNHAFGRTIMNGLNLAKKDGFLSEKIKRRILVNWYSNETLDLFLAHFKITIGRKPRKAKIETKVDVQTTIEPAQKESAPRIPETPIIPTPETPKKIITLQHIASTPASNNPNSTTASITRMTSRGLQTYFPLQKVQPREKDMVDFTIWFHPKLLVPKVITILWKSLSNGFVSNEDLIVLEQEFRLPKDNLQSFIVARWLFRWTPTTEQLRRRRGGIVRRYIGWSDEEDF